MEPSSRNSAFIAGFSSNTSSESANDEDFIKGRSLLAALPTDQNVPQNATHHADSTALTASSPLISDPTKDHEDRASRNPRIDSPLPTPMVVTASPNIPLSSTNGTSTSLHPSQPRPDRPTDLPHRIGGLNAHLLAQALHPADQSHYPASTLSPSTHSGSSMEHSDAPLPTSHSARPSARLDSPPCTPQMSTTPHTPQTPKTPKTPRSLQNPAVTGSETLNNAEYSASASHQHPASSRLSPPATPQLQRSRQSLPATLTAAHVAGASPRLAPATPQGSPHRRLAAPRTPTLRQSLPASSLRALFARESSGADGDESFRSLDSSFTDAFAEEDRNSRDLSFLSQVLMLRQQTQPATPPTKPTPAGATSPSPHHPPSPLPQPSSPALSPLSPRAAPASMSPRLAPAPMSPRASLASLPDLPLSPSAIMRTPVLHTRAVTRTVSDALQGKDSPRVFPALTASFPGPRPLFAAGDVSPALSAQKLGSPRSSQRTLSSAATATAAPVSPVMSPRRGPRGPASPHASEHPREVPVLRHSLEAPSANKTDSLMQKKELPSGEEMLRRAVREDSAGTFSGRMSFFSLEGGSSNSGNSTNPLRSVSSTSSMQALGGDEAARGVAPMPLQGLRLQCGPERAALSVAAGAALDGGANETRGAGTRATGERPQGSAVSTDSLNSVNSEASLMGGTSSQQSADALNARYPANDLSRGAPGDASAARDELVQLQSLRARLQEIDREREEENKGIWGFFSNIFGSKSKAQNHPERKTDAKGSRQATNIPSQHQPGPNVRENPETTAIPRDQSRIQNECALPLIQPSLLTRNVAPSAIAPPMQSNEQPTLLALPLQLSLPTNQRAYTDSSANTADLRKKSPFSGRNALQCLDLASERSTERGASKAADVAPLTKPESSGGIDAAPVAAATVAVELGILGPRHFTECADGNDVAFQPIPLEVAPEAHQSQPMVASANNSNFHANASQTNQVALDDIFDDNLTPILAPRFAPALPTVLDSDSDTMESNAPSDSAAVMGADGLDVAAQRRGIQQRVAVGSMTPGRLFSSRTVTSNSQRLQALWRDIEDERDDRTQRGDVGVDALTSNDARDEARGDSLAMKHDSRGNEAGLQAASASESPVRLQDAQMEYLNSLRTQKHTAMKSLNMSNIEDMSPNDEFNGSFDILSEESENSDRKQSTHVFAPILASPMAGNDETPVLARRENSDARQALPAGASTEPSSQVAGVRHRAASIDADVILPPVDRDALSNAGSSASGADNLNRVVSPDSLLNDSFSLNGRGSGSGRSAAESLARLFSGLEEIQSSRASESSMRLEVLNTNLQSVEEQEKENVIVAIVLRLCICLLSILLLWSTSMGIIDTFVMSNIYAPSTEAVKTQWTSLLNVVNSQESVYGLCVEQQYKSSFQIMAERHAQLRLQLDAEQEIFPSATLLSTNTLNTCANHKKESVDALMSHQGEDGVVVLNLECTNAELAEVRSLLYMDKFETAARIRVAFEEQIKTMSDAFSDFAASVSRYVKYHEDYVGLQRAELGTPNLAIDKVRELIKPIYTFLEENFDNMEFPTEGLPCLAFDATCDDWGFPEMNEQVLAMRRGMADLQAFLVSLKNAVNYYAQGAYNLKQLVVDVAAVAAFVQSLSIFGVHYPVPSLRWPNTPQFDPPEFSNTFIHIDVTRGILRHVDDIKKNVKSQLQVAKRKIHQTLDELLVGLSDHTVKVDFFEDYNPPPLFPGDLEVPFPEVNLDLKQTMSDVVFNIKTSFSSTAKKISNKITTEVDRVVSIIRNFDYTGFVKNAYNYMFPNGLGLGFKLSFPSVDMSEVLEIFANLTFVFVAVDILYRALITLQMITKYIRNSMGKVPVVDIRAPDEDDKASIISKIPPWVIGTAINMLVLLIIVLAAIYFIVSTYIGFYQEYLEGCARSREGTTISLNTGSLSYSVLEYKASTTKFKWESQYELQRTEACYNMTTQYVAAAANFYNTMETDRTAFLTHKSTAQLLVKCVAPDTFSVKDNSTQRLRVHGGGNTGMTYQSFTTLATKSCDPGLANQYPWDDLGKLLQNAGIHERCVSLAPEFLASCSEPDRAIVMEAGHETGCTTEWFVHANVLRYFLKYLMFICFNVSRSCLMSFLTSYFWHYLGTKNVVVINMMSEDGSLAPEHTEEERYKAIKSALFKQKLAACIQIFVAIIIHAPYLYLIFMTSTFTEPQ